jgi:hypothetical protein
MTAYDRFNDKFMTDLMTDFGFQKTPITHAITPFLENP